MIFTALLMQIIQGAFKFFMYLLLLRFWIIAFRLPFRHPLGDFVRVCTGWMTRPFEGRSTNHLWLMLVPLALAWILSFLLIEIILFVFGFGGFGMTLTVNVALTIVGASICEVLAALLWLLTIGIIFQSILSWVHPYAPIMPFLIAFSAPVLNPIRRHVPLIGNIDFSPLIALVIIQILIQALRIWYPFYLVGLRI